MEAQKLGVVASVRRSGAVKPLKLDIAELVKHPEKGTIMRQICDILGIDMSEILFVWASPLGSGDLLLVHPSFLSRFLVIPPWILR